MRAMGDEHAASSTYNRIASFTLLPVIAPPFDLLSNSKQNAQLAYLQRAMRRGCDELQGGTGR